MTAFVHFLHTFVCLLTGIFRLAQKVGFEPACEPGIKSLQGTDGTESTRKYQVVGLNGLQMDCDRVGREPEPTFQNDPTWVFIDPRLDLTRSFSNSGCLSSSRNRLITAGIGVASPRS
jgi:hypothetical protein